MRAVARLVFPVLALLGVGLALNTAPMVGAVMAAAPEDRSSLASASNNTARQVGSALGVAVLGGVAGDPAAPGFVNGFHRAGLVAAACWAVAALVAVVSLRPGGQVASSS